MRDYTVWNPSGNVTVFGTLCPGESAAAVGAALLAAVPAAEQAGFLRYDMPGCEVRLDMAGGEFCGNATLSAAAQYARDNKLPVGSSETVRISCSGVNKVLTVALERLSEDEFRGTVEMPEPLALRLPDHTICPYPAVLLPGIGHVIVEGPERLFDPQAVIRSRCDSLQQEALGILFYDAAACSMVPYVYVKAGDTLFLDGACASGTAALGYYLACKSGSKFQGEIRQPRGTLSVEATAAGRILLTGTTAYMTV